MEITDVRLSLRHEEKLKAYATITFDDCFVVRGIRVIHGAKGLFVAMPSRRKTDGTFQDVAHPIHQSMRDRVAARILQEYETALEEQPDRTAV
jgi:stage V sporulation protein G